MEFIAFLDKIEIEIIRLIEEVGYSTEENTQLCSLGKDYVGFLNIKQKKIVICTNNAKEREGYKHKRRKDRDSFERTALHIKKAIRHEAIHVAQECNNGNLLEIKKNLSMNPSKISALKGSTKISGDERKEIQAYILEDKPKLVKKELEKYCL
tara:strand:+ start:1873 stop:2331 length:459 start_codon:yes stop_codon:yes gene_type:complete